MSKTITSQKTKSQNNNVRQNNVPYSETGLYSFRPIRVGDLKISTACDTILYVLQLTKQPPLQNLEAPPHSSKGSISHVKKHVVTVVTENPPTETNPLDTKNSIPQEKQLEETLVPNISKHQIKKSTKAKSKKAHNYHPVTIEGVLYPTASKAALHLLRSSNFSQSEIARRCGVSQSCVNQLSKVK